MEKLKDPRVRGVIAVLVIISTIFGGITTGLVNLSSLGMIIPGKTPTSVLTIVNTFSTTATYLTTATSLQTLTTSYTATFSTTSITTSTAFSTTVIASTYTPSVPINPGLKILVIPQYGWNPQSNGDLLAIVPDSKSTTFTFVFENQGNTPLDVLCCSVHIEYFPSSLHENSDLGGGADTRVPAQRNATYAWTYPADFPHFPGYQAQITFLFYSLDGSWENPKVVLIYFSS